MLTAKQDTAVMALAGGASITEAAKKAGVERSTLYRWLERPDFKAALADVQLESRTRAVRRLSSALDKAAATAVALLAAKDDAVRLRAAQLVPAMLRELLEIDVHGDAPVQVQQAGPMVFRHADAVAALGAAASSEPDVVDADADEVRRD